MILLEAAEAAIGDYTVAGAIFAGLSTGGLAVSKVIKGFLSKYIKLQELADQRIDKLVKSNEDLVEVVTLLVEEFKRDRSTRSITRNQPN